jgi:ankyrin repeat protein
MSDLYCLQEERIPLHIACLGGHVEVISVLLAAGAAVEAQDKVSAVQDESNSELSPGRKDSPAQCL